MGMNRGPENSLVDDFKTPHRGTREISHDEPDLGLNDEHLDVRNFVPIQAVLHGVSHLRAEIPAAPIGRIRWWRGGRLHYRLRLKLGILRPQRISGQQDAAGKEGTCPQVHIPNVRGQPRPLAR